LVGSAGVDLKESIDDILEIRLSDYPLKESIQGAIQLNEKKIKECIQEARQVFKHLYWYRGKLTKYSPMMDYKYHHECS
jgi:hypothetical protein